MSRHLYVVTDIIRGRAEDSPPGTPLPQSPRVPLSQGALGDQATSLSGSILYSADIALIAVDASDHTPYQAALRQLPDDIASIRALITTDSEKVWSDVRNQLGDFANARSFDQAGMLDRVKMPKPQGTRRREVMGGSESDRQRKRWYLNSVNDATRAGDFSRVDQILQSAWREGIRLVPAGGAEQLGENWGTGTGTAWTIAQGAENDWTAYNISGTPTTAIDSSGFGTWASSFGFDLSEHTVTATTEGDSEGTVEVNYTEFGADSAIMPIFRHTGTAAQCYAGGIVGNNSLGYVVASATDSLAVVVDRSILSQKNVAPSTSTDLKVQSRVIAGATFPELSTQWYLSSGSAPGYDDATDGIDSIEDTGDIRTSDGDLGLVVSGRTTQTYLFKDFTVNDVGVAADQEPSLIGGKLVYNSVVLKHLVGG